MNAVLQILGLFFTPGLWQLALELGALLLLPALGGVISERSGVVNIAMEGMMLTGAFTAVVTDLVWHNALLATLAAAISGGLMALIHAVVSIRFRADQIISGIALNIFALGLTTFLIDKMTNFQGAAHVPQAYTLPVISVPVLSNIPFLGQVLFQQNIMVYVAVALLFAMNIMLFRTRLGLRIRAVGEHPQAADTAGINVYTLRYGAVIASGLLSALGGAFLSIGINNVFLPGMTDGAGYIALAAMIFGKWRPFGAFVACMIFGIGEAIYANNSTIQISQYLLNTLPYILTIVVLAAFVGKSAAPAADGLPYEPGVE